MADEVELVNDSRLEKSAGTVADEVELVNDSGQGKSAGTASEGRLVILGVLAKSAGPGPARSVVKPGGVAG